MLPQPQALLWKYQFRKLGPIQTPSRNWTTKQGRMKPQQIKTPSSYSSKHWSPKSRPWTSRFLHGRLVIRKPHNHIMRRLHSWIQLLGLLVPLKWIQRLLRRTPRYQTSPCYYIHLRPSTPRHPHLFRLQRLYKSHSFVTAPKQVRQGK